MALSAALIAAPARAADLAKVLPDGTQVVINLNIKALLQSPLLRGNEQAFKQATGEAAKHMEGFGIDPLKDLDRLVFAGGNSQREDSMVLLLEGTFDAEKVKAQLKAMADGGKVKFETTEGPGGATVYQVQIPRPNRPGPRLPETVYFTVLDNRHVAFTVDRRAMDDVLTKKQGTKQATVTADVLQDVAGINPKEALSVVIVPPADQLRGSPAEGLTRITGGVTVTDGVRTNVRLATKDAEAAKGLAQTINDGLAQVKQLIPIFAGQQPGIGPKEVEAIKQVLDTFKADVQSGSVIITSDVSKDLIEKVKNRNEGKDK
jgi:hypothetical protein